MRYCGAPAHLLLHRPNSLQRAELVQGVVIYIKFSIWSGVGDHESSGHSLQRSSTPFESWPPSNCRITFPRQLWRHCWLCSARPAYKWRMLTLWYHIPGNASVIAMKHHHARFCWQAVGIKSYGGGGDTGEGIWFLVLSGFMHINQYWTVNVESINIYFYIYQSFTNKQKCDQKARYCLMFRPEMFSV